jgi:cyclic-di-GMP phosphodiesterase, flagellum assembly factor TipF
MRVVGAILLLLCMLIIAGAVGAAVYFYLDAGMLEAATAGVATFALLALYHTCSSHFGFRSAVSRQLADLSRGGADMARQIAEIARRLSALESRFEGVQDQARGVIDPVRIQMSELDARMRQLADTVGIHQTTLDAMARSHSESSATAASPAAAKARDSSSEARVAAAVGAAREVSLDEVRNAVEGSRIDLYLQPIVTLPRRRVRFYEAMSRLRSERGETLQEGEFVPQAERSGLMPRIDYFVIFRCVQIVRRLLMKNRDIGVLCNTSRLTLVDPDSAQQLHDFMAANRAIAPSLILQFSQRALREMAEAEYEKLAVLAELGFRFCLNGVADLRLEAGDLGARGFRYVKVHAPLLLGRALSGPRNPRPGELSDLLGRVGIDLIVDGIDNENSVMELLDQDVRFAQGPLFSAPRPVRAEALQALPNVPEGPAEGLSLLPHPSINDTPASGNSSAVEAESADASSHGEVHRAL